MPELPEVETIVRDSQRLLAGKKIKQVEVLFRPIVHTSVHLFKKMLTGAVFKGVKRRAKYLLFELDKPFVLMGHLKMTGQLVYGQTRQKTKHTHLIFSFSDKTFLHYVDVRKFGGWWLYPQEGIEDVKELKKIGVEPLTPQFSWDFFSGLMSGKKGRIKTVLMDQSFICGIGNIYSDEILFEARVHPLRRTETLTQLECKEIYHAIRQKLEEGIRQRGCSMEDYVDVFGEKGGMQEQLKVYGRKGSTCVRCRQPLKTVSLGGRTGHFCDRCQK